MLPATPPTNEEEHLSVSPDSEVFDPALEAPFDRVLAAAARIFRVPIVMVSFVGRDRQWCKANIAMPVCEIPRDLSFCAQAMLEPNEVMVVPDATLDPRFASHPLVTGPPAIRSYAGAPLLMAEGLAVGAFCVLDTVPRTFTAEETATLADLSATVVEMLGMHRAVKRAREMEKTRDQAEAALRASETRFRHMAANTPGMVYQLVLRPDGSFYFPYVSDGCREIFGLEAEELYADPKRILSILDAEDTASFFASIQESAATLTPWNWEGRSRQSGCPPRWMQGISRPQRYPDGDILSDGMLVDITARKNAQTALEASHNLLSAVIHGTDDAIFIKDRESRYLLMNPAGAAFVGRRPSEMVGLDDTYFFSPEDARRTRRSDLDVMASGQSRTYEDVGLVPDNPRIYLTTKSPYRDAAGNLLGVIGLARDITKQRQNAEALRVAKEEAERANRAKSEFLSRTSHELRTPLHAILGFGQLLELGEVSSNQESAVHHILRAGRHLLALIDEVLALSRIETGRMELSLEAVDVRGIVSDCVNLISRQAAERGIACEDLCACDPGCDYVLADRQRLRQVMLNLLSNAVKYNSAAGRVTIYCRQAPADPAARDRVPRLRIGVTDTGRGLKPEEIQRLFVPFERLDANRTVTEGTGLGLALSKGLVEAMGGVLGVDSVPGQGSSFWVELPAAEHPLHMVARGGDDGEKGSALPEQVPVRGTVLYVEDNLSNLQLIEYIFQKRPGLELLSAQQGLLGLEMAFARPPDLILLDLHLPDLPGWEVLVRLRDDPRTADIPVVIISADATQRQIDRLRAIGVVEYLTKPIIVANLLEMLDRMLGSLVRETAGV